MYSFESSSDQPEQEDKAIYFVHPQEQLTQLANEFNIRYSPTFDPASQNTFSVNQDFLQTNNNVQYELPSFHAFHGIHTEQAILHDLSHPPSVYKSLLQPENTASSPSSVFTAKPTTTTLLPLHTTPIKTAPFEPQISMHPLMSKTKNAPRPGRERAPWTAEEDRLLRLAVALYGDKTEKWSKIAACVPGRTNKNCRKRWFHSLDPLLRKGAWTEKEDQLLREGVSRYPNQWSKIADRLQGRTDDQCAKRWRESLDPTIDRSDWTEAEDARLMEKYETYGSQWQKIACFFEGRPGLHCRNRWRKLERVLQIKQKSLKPSFVNTLLKRKVQPALQDTHPALDSPSCCSPTRPAQAVQDDVRRQSAATPNRAEDEFSDGLRPYGCGVPGCHAAFSSSSGLFNHMKTPHDSLDRIDKPYRCTIKNCSKRYKNINGLQYHLKDAKSTTAYGHSTLFEDKPFPCTLSSCKKTYRTLSGLRYHLQHGHNKEPELVSFDPFQTNQNPL